MYDALAPLSLSVGSLPHIHAFRRVRSHLLTMGIKILTFSPRFVHG